MNFYDAHGLTFAKRLVSTDDHAGAGFETVANLCITLKTAPHLDRALGGDRCAVHIHERPYPTRTIGIS